MTFQRVAGRPDLPRTDRAAQRRRTMSRRQRMILSGVTSNRSPWRRAFAEQGREQGSVRPVQVRAARPMALQDGELVAQDQDLGGVPRFVAPGQPQPRGYPRDQEENEPQAHDR